MSPRAPSVCSEFRCTEDATESGRCEAHKRRAWQRRSPSSVALAGNPEHKRERAAAVTRSGNRCEECGISGNDAPLQLHHPHPIAAGGATVQRDARLLCSGPASCHDLAQADADAEHEATPPADR